jgi:hypothetical protein
MKATIMWGVYHALVRKAAQARSSLRDWGGLFQNIPYKMIALNVSVSPFDCAPAGRGKIPHKMMIEGIPI